MTYNSQSVFNTLTILTTGISYESSTMVNRLVGNCHNTKGKRVSFQKLPENENLKKIWPVKIKRKDSLPKPGTATSAQITLSRKTSSGIFRYESCAF